MSRWEGFEELVAVVEQGSFSAAARQLGVSKSHVSQQVSRLEDRLNTRLLHRTTRKLSLTETGAIYYEQARHAVEELTLAEAAVSSLQQEVSGRLRIAAPHLIGETVLVSALAGFLQDHPKLEIDLQLAGHRVDLVEQRFDLAIQVGAPADGSIISRPLARTRFHVVASPEYLAGRDAPRKPADLKRHRCLLFVASGVSKPWRFKGPRGEVSINLRSAWQSNSGHALRSAAEAGLGLAYLPDYYLREALGRGRLVTLLDDWPAVDREIVALYQHRRHLSVKMRLLSEFLRDHFAREMPGPA